MISCNVEPFVDLTHVKSEAKNDGYKKLRASCDELEKFLGGAKDEWYSANGLKKDKVRVLLDTMHEFRDTGGVADDKNKEVWNKLNRIFKQDPWSKVLKSVGKVKKMYDDISSSWAVFNGGNEDSPDRIETTKHVGKETRLSSKNTVNEPNVSMKIVITTKFDENWYKNKFKSGFLNKMIFAIKTMGRMGTPDAAKTSMSDHKYTKDEELNSSEKGKLDKLKWNMTNKVAKDYISLLLGWSRKKEYTVDNGEKTFTEALKQDKGFGDLMAKKALGGRGFFGRLKQQLFSGQQKSESISVAFQFADPNDGWKFVESKEADLGEDEGGKDGEDGGESGSTKGGSSGSSSDGAGGGAFGSPSSSPELYTPLTATQAQKNPNDATMNLAARVKRLEDEVGITPPTTESTDPFYEDFMEERMELVKEVCEGKADVQTLIEHCLTNDWGN